MKTTTKHLWLDCGTATSPFWEHSACCWCESDGFEPDGMPPVEYRWSVNRPTPHTSSSKGTMRLPTREKSCKRCDGIGMEPYASGDCVECGGSGRAPTREVMP